MCFHRAIRFLSTGIEWKKMEGIYCNSYGYRGNVHNDLTFEVATRECLEDLYCAAIAVYDSTIHSGYNFCGTEGYGLQAYLPEGIAWEPVMGKTLLFR